MNPSPQNGERDPRESGGFSFLYAVLIALVFALVVDMVVHRREARGQDLPVSTMCLTSNPCQAATGHIPQGSWITTESGDRVCRTTMTIVAMMHLPVGFCEDWQSPFRRVYRGETYPTWQGWIRVRPMPWGVQLHTEQGWKP